MGPFPHDAAPPAISDENPMGTDGFEFVEFCHPDPGALDRLFKVMGFSPVAKHRSKDVTLYRQGDVNFILNAEPQSFAARFAAEHGPSAPAMAFRVVDARQAYELTIRMDPYPAPFGDAGLPSVRVFLNERPVASLELGWNPERVGAYSFDVPAGVAKSGLNRLKFAATRAGADARIRVWWVRVRRAATP